MYTLGAETAAALRGDGGDGVYSRAELYRMGWTPGKVDAHVASGRWRLVGRVIATYSGALSRADRWRAGVLHCGPRAVLASFSTLESAGLRSWERDEVHVLAPAGVPRSVVPGLHVVLHRSTRPIAPASRRSQDVAAAAVLAAASFSGPRPGSGLLAATVQQRLVRTSALVEALVDAPGCGTVLRSGPRWLTSRWVPGR